jgi:hypothetical protein
VRQRKYSCKEKSCLLLFHSTSKVAFDCCCSDDPIQSIRKIYSLHIRVEAILSQKSPPPLFYPRRARGGGRESGWSGRRRPGWWTKRQTFRVRGYQGPRAFNAFGHRRGGGRGRRRIGGGDDSAGGERGGARAPSAGQGRIPSGRWPAVGARRRR